MKNIIKFIISLLCILTIFEKPIKSMDEMDNFLKKLCTEDGIENLENLDFDELDYQRIETLKEICFKIISKDPSNLFSLPFSVNFLIQFFNYIRKYIYLHKKKYEVNTEGWENLGENEVEVDKVNIMEWKLNISLTNVIAELNFDDELNKNKDKIKNLKEVCCKIIRENPNSFSFPFNLDFLLQFSKHIESRCDPEDIPDKEVDYETWMEWELYRLVESSIIKLRYEEKEQRIKPSIEILIELTTKLLDIISLIDSGKDINQKDKIKLSYNSLHDSLINELQKHEMKFLEKMEEHISYMALLGDLN